MSQLGQMIKKVRAQLGTLHFGDFAQHISLIDSKKIGSYHQSNLFFFILETGPYHDSFWCAHLKVVTNRIVFLTKHQYLVLERHYLRTIKNIH
ncbi:hypothetical protein MnTg02_01258 [bacterium MnTg02]|nr:hypothetical protein MnTg02_01258 [bacterium MnTg02]